MSVFGILLSYLDSLYPDNWHNYSQNLKSQDLFLIITQLV